MNIIVLNVHRPIDEPLLSFTLARPLNAWRGFNNPSPRCFLYVYNLGMLERAQFCHSAAHFCFRFCLIMHKWPCGMKHPTNSSNVCWCYRKLLLMDLDLVKINTQKKKWIWTCRDLYKQTFPIKMFQSLSSVQSQSLFRFNDKIGL